MTFQHLSSFTPIWVADALCLTTTATVQALMLQIKKCHGQTVQAASERPFKMLRMVLMMVVLLILMVVLLMVVRMVHLQQGWSLSRAQLR